MQAAIERAECFDFLKMWYLTQVVKIDGKDDVFLFEYIGYSRLAIAGF